ncbi:MAG: hypothetical protein P4L67_02690, partial [Candidatus Pacebacteria bacterium]|nr:hypothetical protein [Candidatus Paceibacterota bacterium]
MKIQNFNELAVSDARRATLKIAEDGLEAIDTEQVMREMIQVGMADGKQTLLLGNEVIDLSAVRDVIFIAIGKCATEAA